MEFVAGGVWNFSHDGWKGRLEITSVDVTTRRLSGRYVDAGGRTYSLSGTTDPDPRRFSFVIGLPTPQTFVMAGTTTWNGLTFGFYGTRRP